ncbi:unnamed protein product [Sympodiomycopsis kandeliae]
MQRPISESTTTTSLDEDAYRLAQTQLWSPYVGILLNAALITIVLNQVVKYFQSFSRDKPIIKASVVCLAVIQTTQCIFCFYAGYILFVTKWGNMIPDTVVAAITHALYAWRVYTVFSHDHSKRLRWLGSTLAGLICLLNMTQLASCLVSVYWHAMPADHLTQDKVNLGRTFFRIWLILCIVADCVITISLSFRLNHTRAIRGLQIAIDSTGSKLLWILIPGGLLTIIATVATLAIEIFSTDQDYYSFLLLSLSKLYGISILVCLNMRLQYPIRPNWLPNILDSPPAPSNHNNTEDSGSVMSDGAERFGWLRSNNPCLAHSIAGAGNGIVSVQKNTNASTSNILPILRGSNSISAQNELVQQQSLVQPYQLPQTDIEECSGALMEDGTGLVVETPTEQLEEDLDEKGKKDVSLLDTHQDLHSAHRRSKSLSAAMSTTVRVPFAARALESRSGSGPRPLLLVHTSASTCHRRHTSVDKRTREGDHGRGRGGSYGVPPSPASEYSQQSSVSPSRSSRVSTLTGKHTSDTGGPCMRSDGHHPEQPIRQSHRISTASSALSFTPIEVVSRNSSSTSTTSKRDKRCGRIFQVQQLDVVAQRQREQEQEATTSSVRTGSQPLCDLLPSRQTFGHYRKRGADQQLSVSSTRSSLCSLDIEEKGDLGNQTLSPDLKPASEMTSNLPVRPPRRVIGHARQ